MEVDCLRYQKLAIGDSLSRISRYPLACNELGYILRFLYSKSPKNLQSSIFEDTLTAFRLLPEMQTLFATYAAKVLIQDAQAALPKQKKGLALTEFKVALKRRSKPRQDEEDIRAGLGSLDENSDFLRGGRTEEEEGEAARPGCNCAHPVGSAYFPHDVLVHIFSFLDTRSLVSAAHVCRAWNVASSENCLWQSQYVTFYNTAHLPTKKKL